MYYFFSVLVLAFLCLADCSKFRSGASSDPDCYRNVSQLISSKGYPVEEYWVLTEDGYILGVQRIPYGTSKLGRTAKDRPVVFLQHGLLASSADWVMNFPDQSLGFILADAGYDVWLGNQRGNTYSRRHVKYSPRDRLFWEFSIDEYAAYDIPAMVEFALNVTGKPQLYYVGHSEGTTVAFALLSDRPKYDKIKAVMALGPVATVGYITSPIRYLAPFCREINFLFRLLGFYEFLPNNFLMKILSHLFCRNNELKFLCENAFFLMSGFDPSQLNKTRLDVYVSHDPAGTSTQNVVHFAQMVNSRKFQKYDFGKKTNLIKYNQSTPPEYTVENIRTPIALFWGLNDALADPVDVDLLKTKIKNLIESYRVSPSTWAHIDFIFGIDAPKYVYKELLNVLKKV
ncbi:gastric triacylglycerol lipase-like [Centruroides vittatus]|uniref:gastric triacylglycerol lipase-like n=1 Tax=Centruroides vittatus TaxID=120091 RepID=UPI00350E93C6